MTDPATAQQIVLDRVTYAVQQHVTPEVAEKVRTDVAMANWLGGGLVARLERDVMRHKVLADEQDLVVTGRLSMYDPPMDVLVELPRGFWRWLLRRPPRKRWLPVTGHTALNPPVVGTVTVRADYFRTFPEMDTTYPNSMGPVVNNVQLDRPYGARFLEE